MTGQPQVMGIGNAIVDVLAQVDDRFLEAHGIDKGVMTLVERDRAEALYAAMERPHRAAGGSVANTLAGLGNLGLACGFIGRVADDELGRFYAQGLESGGTRFPNPPVAGGELPTSRSMILVTPDGERSMNTYLGISAELSPDDVPEAEVAAAPLLFLEGYLYDKPQGKAAFERAARLCRGAGGRAGIALSDPFCVERHRADFRRLVGTLDYVIGNEAEWVSLYRANDLDAALEEASAACPLVVCTRSGDGVILCERGRRVEVPVRPVRPVDATGAGDQFAAGFLYGVATGRELEVAGRMGVAAAAEVIGHLGPRPATSLARLFAAEKLI